MKFFSPYVNMESNEFLKNMRLIESILHEELPSDCIQEVSIVIQKILTAVKEYGVEGLINQYFLEERVDDVDIEQRN